MTNNALTVIDQQIEILIQDHKEYSFNALKEKVELILKDADIFLVDNQVDSKAVDLYLANVIRKRNHIKKEQEKVKITTEIKNTKYALIESICQKLEFENQEEVIKKLEELEKKSIEELKEIDKSIKC